MRIDPPLVIKILASSGGRDNREQGRVESAQNYALVKHIYIVLLLLLTSGPRILLCQNLVQMLLHHRIPQRLVLVFGNVVTITPHTRS